MHIMVFKSNFYSKPVIQIIFVDNNAFVLLDTYALTRSSLVKNGLNLYTNGLRFEFP